jgi:hypothetical protein
MATCQYYIERTKNPRICAKKSFHTKSSFLGGVCPDQIPGVEVHFCHNHFGMIANQIRKKIGIGSLIDFQQGRGDLNGHPTYYSREWKLAQVLSILTHRIDEFNRITQASHFAVPSVPEVPLRGVSADDVVFIEEKNENQVLARKFEEAKRDGRYIDLTEPTEQKSGAVDNLNTHFPPEDEKQEHQIDCPVCLDKYSPQNVTFLQCAHPVCNDCLTNIERRNIAQECPVCRIHF